jgi:hypothetical protein
MSKTKESVMKSSIKRVLMPVLAAVTVVIGSMGVANAGYYVPTCYQVVIGQVWVTTGPFTGYWQAIYQTVCN